MASLSLCMIVKNEEDVLGRCLESVKGLADEIIVVDTGSDDLTKEIAAHYTDRIYDFEWRDDFSAARNFAFSKGTKDFLMWLDADDVIPGEEAERFRSFKENLTPDTDVVMMPYAVSFDGAGGTMRAFIFRAECMRRSRRRGRSFIQTSGWSIIR